MTFDFHEMVLLCMLIIDKSFDMIYIMLSRKHNQQSQKLSQLLNPLQQNVTAIELAKILAINQVVQQWFETQIIYKREFRTRPIYNISDTVLFNGDL